MNNDATNHLSLSSALETALEVLSLESRHSKDAQGNAFAWFTLKSPDLLPRVATVLASHQARLCTATCYARDRLSDPQNDIAYHFDVNGHTITVIAQLDPLSMAVPTITPWFRNADWNEREFIELYDIHVEGQPNPRRLFLDPSISEGVLNEAIPLTIMMNGACTKDLWERVMTENAVPVAPSMSSHGGIEPAAQPEHMEIAENKKDDPKTE